MQAHPALNLSLPRSQALTDLFPVGLTLFPQVVVPRHPQQRWKSQGYRDGTCSSHLAAWGLVKQLPSIDFYGRAASLAML